MIPPIQFLDNDGLRTLATIIKRLFATKEELNALSSSQAVRDEIDLAVDTRIESRIENGDISRVQASITDDNEGNTTVVFDSTDSKIEAAVETKIAQCISNGEIGRLQASITDDSNGNLTMTFSS